MASALTSHPRRSPRQEAAARGLLAATACGWPIGDSRQPSGGGPTRISRRRPPRCGSVPVSCLGNPPRTGGDMKFAMEADALQVLGRKTSSESDDLAQLVRNLVEAA